MTTSATAEAAAGDLELARAGDDAAFSRLVAPLHRELHAHCYRMLGSTHDADDALQDTLVKAWRAIDRFEGRSTLRSWLYTIATRTCTDAARARGRRALPMDLGPASDSAVLDGAPRTDVAWLGPYPDAAGTPGTGRSADPASQVERVEAVELAFVAALQHLPGNQRAVLLLVEVIGFAPAEVAAIMATSTGAVTSALQRARRVVGDHLPTRPVPPASATDAHLREVAARFAGALERGDSDALVAMLTADVTWSMPPLPHWYRGRPAVTDFARRVPFGSCGAWRHLPVTANGRPAVALYLRPDGAAPDAPYDAWSITVLGVDDVGITDLTTFIGAEHHARFGLPAALR